MSAKSKYTLVARLRIAVLTIGILLIGYMMYSNHEIRIEHVLLLIIFSACLILLSTLTVEIKADVLEIRFGIGVIREKFPLKNIKSCQPTKNSWFFGRGIRRMKNGCIYNVAGRSVIELQMKDGNIYRIGSDRPEELSEAIMRAVKSKTAVASK